MLKKYWIWICMFVLMVGCLPQNIQTENKEDIPNELKYTLDFLYYSKDLSSSIAGITNRLNEMDKINDTEKDKIKEIWKQHKKYHNMLQSVVNDWYDIVNEGNVANKELKQRSLVYMKNILSENKKLYNMITSLTNGSFSFPKSLLTNMENLYDLIKEMKNE